MPLTEKQTDGAIALIFLAVLAYAFNLLAPILCPSRSVPVPFSLEREETAAVALAVDGMDQGVYFLPRGARVSDLLAAASADLPRRSWPDEAPVLQAGDRICLTSGLRPSLVVGKMSVAQALALDLPVDINSATFDELVLVPGIGEKTAERIISLRGKKGFLRSIEELMEINGIKEKKIAQLRKYFYTQKR
jgi:competence protein ComEA